jgi:hypothetical protein
MSNETKNPAGEVSKLVIDHRQVFLLISDSSQTAEEHQDHPPYS